ncbi:MAG TPA: heme ABC exporter ATP-binding protein CcmA, partial [Gemmatimonadales bacterium]|nr:heme ABC exporter ATP-binding protein CcmA [Gemmatimonadales bacterium]
VIGPNGAGKSTLLRLLAGLLRPDEGEIRVLGQPLSRGAHHVRRSIGLLSHQSLLYDDLTVLENLVFTARLYGLPRPQDVAASALESAGLGERADVLPRSLSRGLLQRLALARTLLHRPRLILLDEPFTALDPSGAERLRAELKSRLSQGAGVVFVTHNLDEVWELASRVAVLVQGRWRANEPRSGSLETFLPRYREMTGA